MTYRATLTLGTGALQVVPLTPAGGGSYELLWRNPGRPDPWGKPWLAQPLAVSRIVVEAPGCTILGAEYFGATRLPDGSWEILNPSFFHYPHRRGGASIPGCEAWPVHHLFDGGSHVGFVRLVPESDQWETAWFASFDPHAANQIRSFVREDLIQKHPFFDKLLGMYRVDLRAFGTGTPGTRTFPWLLYPEHFMARWSGQPGGLGAIRHPMGFGTRAPGNSLNNEHEAHEFHTLVEGIRRNDIWTLNLALALLRYKIAYGLIDCDCPCVWRGRWRNENGDLARGTTGFAPSESKAWDAAVVWANSLTNGEDPIIARGFQVRGDFLRSAGTQWNGAGGARALAHYLENLEHFYLATGDEAFALKAEAQVHKTFQLVGTKNYLPNQTSGSTNEMCYEEGAHAALARWIERRPAALGQYEDRLKLIVEHTLAHCVRSDGRVFYKWNPTAGPGVVNNEIVGRPLAPLEVTLGGHFNGMFMLSLRRHAERWWPGRFSTMFDAMENYCGTIYAHRTDVDACFGPEGPGWEKQVGFMGQGLCQLH